MWHDQGGVNSDITIICFFEYVHRIIQITKNLGEYYSI